MLITLAVTGCRPDIPLETAPRLELAPCPPGDNIEAGLCGSWEVFENRDAAAGRRIALRVVVLPALSTNKASDPVFILAAGVQLLVSTFPCSFKEGQTYVSMLIFVPMIPGMIAAVPSLGKQMLLTRVLGGDDPGLTLFLVAGGILDAAGLPLRDTDDSTLSARTDRIWGDELRTALCL